MRRFVDENRSMRPKGGHAVARALLVLVIAVAVLLSVASPAAAAEVKSGSSITIPAGTTVNDGLYLFGGTVDINGNVNRDATVSAGTLTVRGNIAGSLNVAAGEADIHGAIGRSVRAASGTIRIYGDVAEDVVVAGGTVTIEPGATVRGDVVAAGGDVDVRGAVNGNVRGSAGRLTIAGPVGGSVNVSVGTIRLDAPARIAGKLTYRSRNDLDRDPAAIVAGPTTHREPTRFFPGDNLVVWLGSAVLRLLFALITGVVIVLLLPRAAIAIADGVRRRPLPSFVLGLILLILVPIVVVLLMITVVGIPVALLGLAAYLAALYLSQVFVGLAIGRLILPNAWGDDGRGYNLLAMVIGVIILALLRLIPVPYLGSAIAAITAILGLGAIIVGLRRGHHPRLPGWPPPVS